MTLNEVLNIITREQAEESQVISVSIVVRDENSGDIRVYNSNQYRGIDKYYEYD